MEPTGCPEKFVTKYLSTLHTIPEERGFYVHCGGILKSRIEFYEAQMVLVSCCCAAKSEGLPLTVTLKCGCLLFLVRPPVIFTVNIVDVRRRHFPALRRIFFICSLHSLTISIRVFWVSSTSLQYFIFKHACVLFLAVRFVLERPSIAMIPLRNLL